MNYILPADPKAGYNAYKEEIDQAIYSVLDSGWYILGKQVSCFEEEFAHYMGVRFGIGVGSGTDALQVAIRSCGIGPGDAVITVSHTAVATVSAIDLCGALPILVDINSDTYTMDVNRLEDTIKSNMGNKIKAIIPVHLYGHPADMKAIIDIAKHYGLRVIEDCAQAHGALYAGAKAGSMGDIGAFSFYPTKNLGALGDGGGVVTNNPDLADKLCMLRQYGWKNRYISDIAGMNTRLDELQASILRIKLRHLEEGNTRRRIIAGHYNAALSSANLILPQAASDIRHVYHQYVVRTHKRDGLKAYLHAKGIGTAILYPEPVHQQAGYRSRVAIGAGGLSVSEAICKEILSLPMYPELTENQIQKITETILEWQ